MKCAEFRPKLNPTISIPEETLQSKTDVVNRLGKLQDMFQKLTFSVSSMTSANSAFSSTVLISKKTVKNKGCNKHSAMINCKQGSFCNFYDFCDQTSFNHDSPILEIFGKTRHPLLITTLHSGNIMYGRPNNKLGQTWLESHSARKK